MRDSIDLRLLFAL